jgi:ABC-2 type transport system ATP-binding protein
VANYHGPAIVVDKLHVSRGRRKVLHGVTVSVEPGQVVGLLGPSGCGKTTLMRSIVGVQRIDSGTVTVLGIPAGAVSLRRRVGYVTQSASVYDDLTVKQNLTYFQRVLGAERAEVDRVIDATDLRAHMSQLVGSLSGGQRARVSLAAALIGSPDLLVLDEPTVGLDPVLRVELWRLFHEPPVAHARRGAARRRDSDGTARVDGGSRHRGRVPHPHRPNASQTRGG